MSVIEQEPGAHEAPPINPASPAKKTNWALWLFIFGAAFVFVVAASFYSLFRSMRGVTPSISRGSALSIDLARHYPEDPLYDVSGPFVDVPDITFRDLLFSIRSAKEDSRVEKLFLHVRASRLGWANTSELHSRLLDFKSSGKPVVAFVEYAGNRDYFVASAADEIYLHPRSSLDLRGIRAEMLYIKGTLDKLGVEAEFERFGEYKDAPDMFLRESMSESSREAVSDVVDTLHETMVRAIAKGRGLEADEVRALIEDGPFTAEQALSRGLVDGLKYIDEARATLSREGEEEKDPKTVAVTSYRRAARGSSLTTKASVALIYGIGAIVGGASTEDAAFGRVMGSDTIGQAFKDVRENDDIEAVIFRIDSPGGSDVASDVIWREAKLTAEKKPVIVSMGNVAASGGYWIAMASDTIVAEPTTITGSIGIYGGKFNLAGLYEKLGFNHDGVSSAPNADFFSDNRSFTEKEREQFRRMIESGYQAFLERVAEARDMTTDEVHAVAQGRVWSGQSALEHGLVDELGGLERALEIAKEAMGLAPTDLVGVYVYPEKKNLLEVLLESLMQTRAQKLTLTPQELLEHSPMLRALAKGQPLAMMPYELELN